MDGVGDVLGSGEEPPNPGDFVLLEEVRLGGEGAPAWFKVTAAGTHEDERVAASVLFSSAECAAEWAQSLSRTWQSRPQVYVRRLADDGLRKRGLIGDAPAGVLGPA